jgi:hypothetical protein
MAEMIDPDWATDQITVGRRVWHKMSLAPKDGSRIWVWNGVHDGTAVWEDERWVIEWPARATEAERSIEPFSWTDAKD